jgi:hypothetical protein
MNFRRAVIPPRNNRKHEADPSLHFSSNKPISACKGVEKARLAENTIIDKSTRKILDAAIALAISWRCSVHRRGSSRRCVGNRKLSEVIPAMSFLAKPMEISNAGLDNNSLTESLQLSFCYSSQE